jgi:DNA replication and repair protein RecF
VRILSARISGFRNLDATELEFAAGVNLILGANGQGKTNLLEALHYPALARSHRGARNDDLIAFDVDALHVELALETESGGPSAVAYGLRRGGERRFRVDGSVVAKRSELVGRLAAVYFEPGTTRLVREGPSHRRQFLDGGIAQIDPAYLSALTAYHRTLRQKSRLLREARHGPHGRYEHLEEARSWNAELARYALVLVRGRAQYVQRLQTAAAVAHERIAGTGEALEVAYLPDLRSARADLENDDLERDIRAEFDYIWSDELRRGHPLRGPQRDDLDIRLAGRDLRVFGSQGETRTASVALVLGQAAVVHERRGIRPVVFLDDIFSELDRARAQRLQELVAADHQLFVATARHEDVEGWRLPNRRVWSVTGGALSETDASLPQE